MRQSIEQSPPRFALPGRVRKSFDDALYKALLLEIGAAHALLEWANLVDDGLDEIRALRHPKEGQHTPAGQSSGTTHVLPSPSAGPELQDYARVARKTLSNCYQSYVELSELLDSDHYPRDVKNKPVDSDPGA
jgi:hypothetical protein